jgi:hypothetical protein
MKRDFFWMLWGVIGLVLVLMLGTKTFVAEASFVDTGHKANKKCTERKAIVVTPEQYKVIKIFNFNKNH